MLKFYWKQFFFSNFQNGVKHVHAFIHTPTGTHFCEVEQLRSGEKMSFMFDSVIAILVFFFFLLNNSVYQHQGEL